MHLHVEYLEDSCVCFIQVNRLFNPKQWENHSGKFGHHLKFLDGLHLQIELQTLSCRQRWWSNLITKEGGEFKWIDLFERAQTISRWRNMSCSFRFGFNPSTFASNFSSASKNWGLLAMKGAPVHANLLKRKRNRKSFSHYNGPSERRLNLIKLQIQRSLRWTFRYILVSTKTMLRRIALNEIEQNGIQNYRINAAMKKANFSCEWTWWSYVACGDSRKVDARWLFNFHTTEHFHNQVTLI